jgi:chemotaxis protein MotB
MNTFFMKKYTLIVMLLFLTAALSNSCVSKKRYLKAVDRGNRLANDSMNTHLKLDVCNTAVKGLQSDKGSLQNEKGQLQNQNGELETENQKIINELNKLSSTSKMTIADQARRLKSLQDLIQAQKDAMNGLKQTIANALVNFKADELTVYVKDGNVYVSLQEKLLFKSGSADVDPKGKQALAKLAEVLNSTADVGVVIEGHTDNVPIKTGKFEDNWALSTGRAASIVRILTKDYGFDPNRIAASGKGEFHPVQPNATPEGRSANRRTEIIISPNLSKLYDLINQ